MIWQIKKLGEICDFQNGFAFKSSEYVDSGFFCNAYWECTRWLYLIIRSKVY